MRFVLAGDSLDTSLDRRYLDFEGDTLIAHCVTDVKTEQAESDGDNTSKG